MKELETASGTCPCQRSDDNIIGERPKPRYPGASPCAMGRRQSFLLVQRVSGGVKVPVVVTQPKGQSVTRVDAEQAVKTIA